MKKLLQIVSVPVIALLLVVPVIDGLPCASIMASGSSCPMGMRAMGADCPMAGQTASGSCSESCCKHGTLQKVWQVVRPVKPKLRDFQGAVVTAVAVSADQPIPAHRSRLGPMALSPPRYILLRVFRI